MAKTGKIIVLISSLFIGHFVFAQAAPKVEATVDRQEMGVGDTVTLTVSVTVEDADDVGEPDLRGLNGFELMNSQKGQSSFSTLTAGTGGMTIQKRTRFDYQYLLAAQKQGTFEIPPLNIVIDGKTYRTQSINMRVLAEGSGAAAPQVQGNQGSGLGGFGINVDQMDEMEKEFLELLKRRQQGAGSGGGVGNESAPPDPRSLPKNPKEAFSIQVAVDKTTVYEGEQVTVNWYIYSRGNIIALDRLKFPDLKGFWKEIIEEVPALNFVPEEVNGVQYRKALLASHALFPIKAGNSYIDEFKIKATVQLPTSPFGAFGFGQPYTYTRASDKVKLTVKPLPAEGKPADFAGAVGDFEVFAQVDGDSYPVNQPFSLRVRFEGSGNAKMIELPALNLPSNIELYNTKAESKFFKNGKSYKEFEVLLIPREEGALTIPALSFSMFDPKKEKYVTRKTNPIQVKITPNNGGNQLAADRMSQNGKPAAKASTGPSLPEIIPSYESGTHAASSMSLSMWGGLYLGVIAALFFRAQRAFGWGRRRRDLREVLQKRMKRANRLADTGDYRATGTEMTNILYTVLGEIVGTGKANLEIGKLLDEAPPSLRRELGAEIRKHIDVAQVICFAPEELVGRYKEKMALKEELSYLQKTLAKAIELAQKEE